VGTDYNGGGSVIGNWITGNSYGIGIGGMESGIGEAWNNMLADGREWRASRVF